MPIDFADPEARTLRAERAAALAAEYEAGEITAAIYRASLKALGGCDVEAELRAHRRPSHRKGPQ